MWRTTRQRVEIGYGPLDVEISFRSLLEFGTAAGQSPAVGRALAAQVGAKCKPPAGGQVVTRFVQQREDNPVSADLRMEA